MFRCKAFHLAKIYWFKWAKKNITCVQHYKTGQKSTGGRLLSAYQPTVSTRKKYLAKVYVKGFIKDTKIFE